MFRFLVIYWGNKYLIYNILLVECLQFWHRETTQDTKDHSQTLSDFNENMGSGNSKRPAPILFLWVKRRENFLDNWRNFALPGSDRGVSKYPGHCSTPVHSGALNYSFFYKLPKTGSALLMIRKFKISLLRTFKFIV